MEVNQGAMHWIDVLEIQNMGCISCVCVGFKITHDLDCFSTCYKVTGVSGRTKFVTVVSVF